MAAAPPEPQTFACDSCDDTSPKVATFDELEAKGWRRYFEHGVLFVMCSACVTYFTPVWERRRAKRHAEQQARGRA